jgi:hypothetical protein
MPHQRARAVSGTFLLPNGRIVAWRARGGPRGGGSKVLAMPRKTARAVRLCFSA